MERRRQIKKHTRTKKETIIWFLVGTVLSIYVGMLFGAVWMPDNSLNEYLSNFVEFIVLEHHFIVGVTGATPVFVGIFWTAFFLAFILEITKIEHPFAGEEYGIAKWGNAKEFTKEFSSKDESSIVEVNTGDVKLGHPLYVNTSNYWIAEGVYLSIKNEKTSNLNMLVVGPPGSGKSFRLARPMLSQLCGNFLVTDPKGELYKQTGQYFEDNGYEVMVMNVESEEGMPMSIHFNPFRYIRNESDILSIAGILMKATTPPDDGGGAGNDQFFEQSAETLLICIIYMIHYGCPKEEQTWSKFVELLNATTVFTTDKGAIDNRADGILKICERMNVEWKAHHDYEFPGIVDIRKYYNGAAETTSSIVASLDAHCRYMKLKCVIDLLSEDEIHITDSFGYCRKTEESKTGKRILYIVTSEDKRYYDWIPSMVYSLFFDELYHLTAIDHKLHETLPEHLTFLMDEFSNVTLPDSFVEKLSTMRSRNMSAVIIVQNLIQLKRKFPKYDMDKDLIGNCAVIDILGAPDMDSCEYLSKHFGTQTIHKASDSDSKDHKGSSSRSEDVMEKSLLSAEDIFAMKKDGECAIVVKGTDPLYELKCQMEKTDFVKLLCRKKNPYNPDKARERKISRKRNGEIYSGEAARKEADKLREEGVAIIRLTDVDVDALFAASRGKAKVSLPPTKEQLKAFEKNRKRYDFERDTSELDFEEYKSGDMRTRVAKDKYIQRVYTAKELSNAGFSNAAIRCMKSLIMADKSSADILKMFQPSASVMEIKKVCDAINI